MSNDFVGAASANLRAERESLVNRLEVVDRALGLVGALDEDAVVPPPRPKVRDTSREDGGSAPWARPGAKSGSVRRRGRYSNAERQAAIELGDELGNDAEAQRRLGLSAGTLSQWRAATGANRASRPTALRGHLSSVPL